MTIEAFRVPENDGSGYSRPMTDEEYREELILSIGNFGYDLGRDLLDPSQHYPIYQLEGIERAAHAEAVALDLDWWKDHPLPRPVCLSQIWTAEDLLDHTGQPLTQSAIEEEERISMLEYGEPRYVDLHQTLYRVLPSPD